MVPHGEYDKTVRLRCEGHGSAPALLPLDAIPVDTR